MISRKNIENSKVHLVLGSGGARGIAHIGVINELEKLNCEIVSVAGCSMGAVIGGIYCTGKLPVFMKWLRSISKRDVLSLLDFTLSTAGFIKGEKILNSIEKLIGAYNIEDLPIPFVAVATDLANRKEVYYTHGNLYKAIRASISIPTLFTPLIDHDKLLIDGGILNPLPLSTVKKAHKNEIVVAVNLCDEPEKTFLTAKKREPLINMDYFGTYKDILKNLFPDWLSREETEPEAPNIISILNQTIEIMQDRVTSETIKLYKPDVLVNIKRDFAKTMDFHLSEKLIAEGVRAFHYALEEKGIVVSKNKIFAERIKSKIIRKILKKNE